MAALARLALALLLGLGQPVTHVHASGRFDRSPVSLARSLAGYERRGTVVTVTEVWERPRAATLHRVSGWSARTPRPTDLGIMWARARWRLVTPDRHRLAAGPGPLLSTWALSVVLDPRPPYAGPRLLVSVSHLPHGGARWTAAVHRWHARLLDLRRRWCPCLLVVAADWNVALRQPAARAAVRAVFPRLALTWRAPLPPGRSRLLDGTLTNGRGRARLLPRTAASDHRAYIERLSGGTT